MLNLNHAIIKTDKGLSLVSFIYHWSSDRFDYEYGNSKTIHSSYDELPFKDNIIARLSYRWSVGVMFYDYPENNKLSVSVEDKSVSIDWDMIKKLRGYKKFFGNKNIKGVEFL